MKYYDFLKNVVLPCLMASSTLVMTVGQAWNIPNYKAIAITFGALATFLSSVLNQASKDFFKDKQIISVPEESEEAKG